MNILLVNLAPIPVFAYGGTERVVWDLGKALVELGHRVTYLVPEGSTCPFAHVLPIRPHMSWSAQIPADIDLVHFHFDPNEEIDRPWLMTEHTNNLHNPPLPLNTVFVSSNHAARYNSTVFVHNGLDWSAYANPSLDSHTKGPRFHFLGKVAWRVKNVQGAIDVARRAGQELDVLGGTRLNIKRGFRWTWSPRIHFHGMVGGAVKFDLLNRSRGLIFPVRWHEPFGLAVIEILFFGAPVYATPYGALPELVPAHVGTLSTNGEALVEAVRRGGFDPQACHQHAVDHFSHRRMARQYAEVYERILGGELLHPHAPQRQGAFKQLPWAHP